MFVSLKYILQTSSHYDTHNQPIYQKVEYVLGHAPEAHSSPPFQENPPCSQRSNISHEFQWALSLSSLPWRRNANPCKVSLNFLIMVSLPTPLGLLITMIRGLGFCHSGSELKLELIEASKVRINSNRSWFSTVGTGIEVAHPESLI